MHYWWDTEEKKAQHPAGFKPTTSLPWDVRSTAVLLSLAIICLLLYKQMAAANHGSCSAFLKRVPKEDSNLWRVVFKKSRSRGSSESKSSRSWSTNFWSMNFLATEGWKSGDSRHLRSKKKEVVRRSRHRKDPGEAKAGSAEAEICHLHSEEEGWRRMTSWSIRVRLD